MKIIQDLNGTTGNADFPNRPNVLTAVHNEPRSGFFRQALLTSDGLILRRRNHEIGIPLHELFKLAEQHEPALTPDGR